MELWIYDRNLRFKGIIENHTSLIWRRKFYECGTFELHAPITSNNLELLKPGNIITKGDKKEAAVIRGMKDEESTEVMELARTGYFLPIYFNDRLTGPTINYSGTIENAMYKLANTPIPIPRLTLADKKGFEERTTFQATYKNTLTYLEKLARAGAMGYRIIPNFEEKILIFEVYKGKDRSMAQTENSRVIFSETYGNLNRTLHEYNDELYKTKVIVGGAGEGTERIYVTVGGGEGLDLRETFLDAKDINNEEMTEAEYLEALETRGREYLANECGISESIEAETEIEINFTYQKDYDLGDIVTVQKKDWGINLNLRITGLEEVHENGAMYVVPTFGDPMPEKINWNT